MPRPMPAASETRLALDQRPAERLLPVAGLRAPVVRILPPIGLPSRKRIAAIIIDN